MIRNSGEEKKNIIQKITEPKVSFIILWEYFSHFERQNIMKLILVSVIFLIMIVCFFRISNHAVLLGRPVDSRKSHLKERTNPLDYRLWSTEVIGKQSRRGDSSGQREIDISI